MFVFPGHHRICEFESFRMWYVTFLGESIMGRDIMGRPRRPSHWALVFPLTPYFFYRTPILHENRGSSLIIKIHPLLPPTLPMISFFSIWTLVYSQIYWFPLFNKNITINRIFVKDNSTTKHRRKARIRRHGPVKVYQYKCSVINLLNEPVDLDQSQLKTYCKCLNFIKDELC